MFTKVLIDGDETALVIGADFRRWYVGIAIETPQAGIRVAVFRVGPFLVQLIHRFK